MKFNLRRLVRWSACGVLAGCIASQAAACRFIPRAPEALLKAADVVFVGKVLESLDGRGGDVPTGWGVFEVVEVNKGQMRRGDRLKVLTHNSSCGISFSVDQVWTVFASGSPLRTDAPSGSFIVDSASGGPGGR